MWRKALGHFATFALVLMIATAPQLLAIAALRPSSHRAAWEPERITASIDGLFYRQLQYDLFDRNKTLRLVTWNVPWLGFVAGLPLSLAGLAAKRRVPGDAL